MRFFTYTTSTHINAERQNRRPIKVVSLIFFMCVFFLPAYQIVTAQTIHIPDPGLRTTIELALGKEVGEDITQADMASLEELDALKSGVRDLTGLEFAINLIKLELRGNRISDVSPLKNLTNLTKLRLGTNHKISDVSPLKNLTNLTFLDIDSNQISDVSPLKNLTNLTWLDLDDNGILDVSPLKVLTNLRYLDLDGNKVLDVSPLKNLTNLIFLDIDDNGISDISPLSVLVNLKVLDLDGNRISDTSPLSVLINLTELDLHDNEILDISPLSVLLNLTELDLHDNKVSDVSPLRGLINLKVLNLSSNHISDFSSISGLIENLIAYDAGNQTEPTHKTSDVNRDGVVDLLDLIVVTSHYGVSDLSVFTDSALYPDVNSDGSVDVRDLVIIAAEIGSSSGAPNLSDLPVDRSTLTTESLSRWIELAKHLDSGDSRIRQGLTFLEALLSVVSLSADLPQETSLLANYPNPFNPETWIPYQLSEASLVNISIYSADGKRVRKFELGVLPAGMYHSKSRAMYWDGKNELGESVASGVYFYTLTADDFTATGKMFIRK